MNYDQNRLRRSMTGEWRPFRHLPRWLLQKEANHFSKALADLGWPLDRDGRPKCFFEMWFAFLLQEKDSKLQGYTMAYLVRFFEDTPDSVKVGYVEYGGRRVEIRATGGDEQTVEFMMRNESVL